MGHPAHVHLFKNFIWEMEKRGHEVKVTARDKDVTHQLLDAYHIPYEVVGKFVPGKIPVLKEWIYRSLKIAIIGRKFNADMYIGVLNPATAFAAWINRRFSLTFNDTEHAKFAKRVTFPFTDHILTPSCYIENIGKKQIRYVGYHELAYLHPHYFKPNPSILDEIGLKETDPFIIVRLVSWNAVHDENQSGLVDKIKLIQTLNHYRPVLISSEAELPEELKKYKIKISQEKILDLIHYSTLYLGEGATMASEAALCGTPSIYVSSLSGTMGNLNELEHIYGLVYSFSDSETALRKAEEILTDPESNTKWKIKQNQLMKEKIDVTSFMIQFIENYPASADEKRKISRS